MLSSLSTAVTVGPSGSGAFSFTIPGDLGLVGASFHNQFLVQDAAANQLGWVVTNGGTGKIGRP